MCEYFLSEEISKIVRAFFSREKLQKCEYFSEYPKFGEDFEREHFKFLVIKKRVKRSFSKVEKARKKKVRERETREKNKKKRGKSEDFSDF